MINALGSPKFRGNLADDELCLSVSWVRLGGVAYGDRVTPSPSAS
jgi:hypothetical protein